MATLTLNPAAIQAMLSGPGGAVQRDMVRRGEAVIVEAQRLLARSEHTGELAASLEIKLVPTGGVWVGSDLPYVNYLHNGTGPAHITSDGAFGSVSDPRAHYRPPWRKPEFAQWATDHGMVAFKLAAYIFANGTAPNPFLTQAMNAART